MSQPVPVFFQAPPRGRCEEALCFAAQELPEISRNSATSTAFLASDTCSKSSCSEV